MSAVLENTSDELSVLVGATIEAIWVHTDTEDGWMPAVTRMRVRYANDVSVNGHSHGEYEFWQDEEGNGPGYIAFVQEG